MIRRIPCPGCKLPILESRFDSHKGRCRAYARFALSQLRQWWTQGALPSECAVRSANSRTGPRPSAE